MLSEEEDIRENYIAEELKDTAELVTVKCTTVKNTEFESFHNSTFAFDALVYDDSVKFLPKDRSRLNGVVGRNNNKRFLVKKFNIEMDKEDFSKEILLSKAIDHEFLVKVCHVFKKREKRNLFNNYYMFMEFADLGPLMTPEFVTSSNKPPEVHSYRRFGNGTSSRFELDEAKEYMKDVLHGLQYLHQTMKHCHLDLKPANIVCQSRGDTRPIVKIIDFGIASPIDENGKSNVRCNYGTPGFIPFEAKGQPDDGDMALVLDGTKFDMFSLGITFYIMLTGKLQVRYENGVAWPSFVNEVNGSFTIPEISGRSRVTSSFTSTASFFSRNTPSFLLRKKSARPRSEKTVKLEERERMLVQRMCHADPEARPTIDDLLEGYFQP